MELKINILLLIHDLMKWMQSENFARVVELVDTRDLKSLAEKRAGSSPAPGTIFIKQNKNCKIISTKRL